MDVLRGMDTKLQDNGCSDLFLGPSILCIKVPFWRMEAKDFGDPLTSLTLLAPQVGHDKFPLIM